jgi:hypothetical protein
MTSAAPPCDQASTASACSVLLSPVIGQTGAEPGSGKQRPREIRRPDRRTPPAKSGDCVGRSRSRSRSIESRKLGRPIAIPSVD